MRGITDLDTLIEGFRLCCMAEQKSPKTIRWYMGKLAYFSSQMKAMGFPTRVDQITTTHLRRFIAHLCTEVWADENNPYKPARQERLSSHTVQGYVRTIKAFYSWPQREGHIQENPAGLVRVPKAKKVIIQTFSEDQIRRVVGAIDRGTPGGFRNYCIVLLLLDTGIRLSELVSLKVPDLDLERGHFKVLGKGWKERIVPLGALVQRALWRYVNQYRPEAMHAGIEEVFLTRAGTAVKAGWVYRMIARRGQKAGLTGVRCSPHTFRHTFAKRFLLNGGDVLTLQKILGHSSLEVVKMYLALSSGDVRQVHRKYSAVDMLRVSSGNIGLGGELHQVDG